MSHSGSYFVFVSGDNKVEDRKMTQSNKSGNEKTFQATTEILLLSFKRKILIKGHMEL